ncbi:hypothetical protein [Photobacterium leiognathi]
MAKILVSRRIYTIKAGRTLATGEYLADEITGTNQQHHCMAER